MFDYNSQKENCIKRINKIEEGDHTEVLYERRDNPDDYMTLGYIKTSEIIEQAFREDRNYCDDEISHTERIKYCDYIGRIHQSKTIERDYMLVPKDPKDRELFKNVRLSGETASFKGFTAQLESYKYEPYYKANIVNSGKNKVSILFEL